MAADSRSPGKKRAFSIPSLISKKDIVACIDSELDFDLDGEGDGVGGAKMDPMYAECTCVRFEAPSPPPPLTIPSEERRGIVEQEVSGGPGLLKITDRPGMGKVDSEPPGIVRPSASDQESPGEMGGGDRGHQQTVELDGVPGLLKIGCLEVIDPEGLLELLPPPPPQLLDSRARRPLPPPPSPPPPPVVNKTTAAAPRIGSIGDDAFHFSNSVSKENERTTRENLGANLSSRPPCEQLGVDLDDGKTTVASKQTSTFKLASSNQNRRGATAQYAPVRKEPTTAGPNRSDTASPGARLKTILRSSADYRTTTATTPRTKDRRSSSETESRGERNIDELKTTTARRVGRKTVAEEKEEKEKGKNLYRSRSISPPSTSSGDFEQRGRPSAGKVRSGILKNKHPDDPSKVRISLYYTWSFSGPQNRRRPELRLDRPLSPPPPSLIPPPPPPIVDPSLLLVKHIRSYSVRQPLTRYRSPSSTDQHHHFVDMSRRSDYGPGGGGGGRRNRAMMYSTSTNPRNRQYATMSYDSRTVRPTSAHYRQSLAPPPPPPLPHHHHCYATINDTPQMYRNIFPYTTLYRTPPSYPQYRANPPPPPPPPAYQTLSPASFYAHPHPHYDGQPPPSTAELVRSIRRQHRYPTAEVPSDASPAAPTRNGFEIYVSDSPYHMNSAMGPQQSSGGSMGVMEEPTMMIVNPIHAEKATTIERTLVDDQDGRGGSEDGGIPAVENGRCSSRACLVGWMLALTAVIILALAIGLFVQISRESSQFDKLRRQESRFETTPQFEKHSTAFR